MKRRILNGLLIVLTLTLACDRTAPPATRQASPRVASLVPAVTHSLLELGHADALVAVSNYDTGDRVAGLPRAGDLLNVDWEALAAAGPTLMVVQIAPDKVPPGLRERADALGVELLNVRLNTLPDIRQTLDALQARVAPGEASWAERFDERLEATRSRVAGREAVATLLALGPDATFVAGPGSYLDELLSIAGGANVLPADAPPYPTLDRERLSSLRPTTVVMILPAASPTTLSDAERFKATLPPTWPAGRGDVTTIDDPYALVPGWGVLDLADRLADALHPVP